MSAPKLRVLAGVGLVIGIANCAFMAAVPGGVIFMPITFGSLPGDICFFIGGIIAKRNRWLEGKMQPETEWIPRTRALCAHGLTAIFGAGTIVVLTWMVHSGGSGFVPNNPPYDPATWNVTSRRDRPAKAGHRWNRCSVF